MTSVLWSNDLSLTLEHCLMFEHDTCGNEPVLPDVRPQTKTYVSWSSNFVLYLEDYLMYEHDFLGLRIGMS